MVADERPVLSENEHAHDVVSDLGVAQVGLGQVSRGDALEGFAVRRLLRDALAGVLADLAVDEDQRVVLVGGDEVRLDPDSATFVFAKPPVDAHSAVAET